MLDVEHVNQVPGGPPFLCREGAFKSSPERLARLSTPDGCTAVMLQKAVVVSLEPLARLGKRFFVSYLGPKSKEARYSGTTRKVHHGGPGNAEGAH